MEKIKRVISVFISVLVFIGLVNPTVINAAISFKDTHFYEVDNTILWSADGSTDITEYDSNLKATVIKVGSKVVLDSREEPFETHYIADNKRDYGSDNIVLDEGKTGLFERYYLKEKGQQKERYIAANFSTSGASKRGDQVGAYVKVTNLTNYPMYDVHVHAFPKEFLSYVSADMPGTPDPDSGGAWFFFEKIDPKDTVVVNVIYSLTSDCDSQQYSAGAAVGNSKARPAFKEPTTGWIAMNTQEGVTRQKQDAVISVGTKPKTETITIPHKKLEPKAGFEIIPGKDGSKDVVTTYTVDPKTGQVTPKVEEKNYVAPVDETYKAINYTYEGDPEMDYGKERKDEAKKIIYKGIKSKTEHVVIPHKKLEPKAGFEIIPGKDGSKDIVTTYTVDKQTGKVTPKVEEKNYVAPVDEQYKAKPTKSNQTVKKAKVIKKPTETNPSVRIINNNVNQVKVLPNTATVPYR